MKGEVNHITYNAVRGVVEIHFENGHVKESPMTVEEWDSMFDNGPQNAMDKINELIDG